MKKETREKVYNKFGGRCAYCGEEIKYKEMQVDHIVPKRNFIQSIKFVKTNNYSKYLEVPEFLRHLNEEEFDNIDNLFPACRVCNKWKDVHPLNIFRKEIEEQLKRLNKYSSNFRMAKKYGLVAERPSEVTFYFEKVSDKYL